VNPGVPRVSSIIAAVARGSSAPRTGADPRLALDLVERAYRALLASILAHPEMRRLASAWLGLRWFVDRCDFRSGVELEVACVPREEVLQTLRGWAERDEDSDEPPIDLFLVDHGVGPEDVALLAAWGSVAAGARAPVVVSLDPSSFVTGGLATLDEAVRRADDPTTLIDERLRAFARTDDARWVVASVNGARARPPHAANRGAEIAYEEASEAAAHDVVSPSLLVGAIAAASHTRCGWATDVQGVSGGIIDDLPLGFAVDDGEELSIPLQALVRETAARALGRQGIAVASCVANRDQAMFFRVPTLFREPSDEGERATATLGDQLFTRRLAGALELVASAVPATSEVRAIEETAIIVLTDLFGNDRAKPEIRIGVEGEPRAGNRVLRLSCSPRGFHGVSLSRVDLAARIGS
jgi:predicted component of type VI protein secretion system